MRFSRYVFACAILPVFFLSPCDAEAQTGATYRFLEVMNVAGQPVAEATVEAIPPQGPPQKTDANGVLESFIVYFGDFNTSGLRVSKAGYIPHEEMGLRGHSYDELFEGEVPGYDPKKIKIVLLKEPVTAAERRAVEVELRRREFILAVRQRDLANVERLLRAGASAETKDDHGIPVILFAAANGDLPTIQALLKAGAEVRNKSRPGRKALRYYLDSMSGDRCAANEELVQTLIKAGADVNAVNRHGQTPLASVEWCKTSPLHTLLERAGARRK